MLVGRTILAQFGATGESKIDVLVNIFVGKLDGYWDDQLFGNIVETTDDEAFGIVASGDVGKNVGACVENRIGKLVGLLAGKLKSDPGNRVAADVISITVRGLVGASVGIVSNLVGKFVGNVVGVLGKSFRMIDESSEGTRVRTHVVLTPSW